MERPLVIEVVIGYMLKVIKAKKKIIKYKNEFNAIRHGDYFEFINLIKEPFGPLVSYKNGIISIEKVTNKEDCDFEGLLRSGNSMRKFYNECFQEFGFIEDNDINDKIFYDAALFEISIRMHARNYGLIKERENLITIISKLCKSKNISEKDTILMDNGRVFVNMIKHYKNQFSSWEEGIVNFKIANEILIKHEITLF